MSNLSKYRFPDGPLSSARHIFAITPSDTAEITLQMKGIYVGGGGNLSVRGKDSSADVTFVGVPAGTILDIDPQLVLETDTTATNLVGLA